MQLRLRAGFPLAASFMLAFRRRSAAVVGYSRQQSVVTVPDAEGAAASRWIKLERRRGAPRRALEREASLVFTRLSRELSSFSRRVIFVSELSLFCILML